MGVSSRGGLLDYLARLGRPPVADSDADLLDRFVRTADEFAFAGIVRRHGPMVLAVCRRRLGHEADAEDAFQAVFLALARSAPSIGRRESLAGWLYRVAYLVSLKAAGRRARRRPAALGAAEVPMPDPPTPAWETEELKATIDAELAALPDRFRSVVVLCLVEGRTNAEAAAVLGVPVGTVDSRLSAARAKLRAALTRRGLAVGAGVSLEQLYGGLAKAADVPALQELVSVTVRAVLAEAAGPGAGAVSPAVADLARGVTTMATTFRVITALAITLSVLGAAGAYLAAGPASSETPPAPTAALAAPAAEAQDTKGAKGAKAEVPKETGAAALDRPFGVPVPAQGLSVRELFEHVEDQTELVVRVDVAAFRRLGVFAGFGPDDAGGDANQFLNIVYETKAVLPRKADKLPIRDVLADALAQVNMPFPCTYQIRGSQLLIVPAYVPPVRPGINPLQPSDDDLPILPLRQLQEQIYGGVVSIAAERKPLSDILADLRKQTGANIVLDPRCLDQAGKTGLTVSLNDVRLYDALRVVADMAELKMVYAGNIYYVTTRENARAFQPPAPQPSALPFAPPPSSGK
jgi:RNA polymerase sigma factor (sigma-70 family)